MLDRRRFVMRGMAATLTAVLGNTSTGHAQRREAEPEFIAAFERAEIERLAKRFIARYEVPGLGIAFARDGRILHEDAFGVADPIERTPLTPAYRFRIASISKQITSVTIFTLIEAGRLRLDDRVFGADGVLGNDYGPVPTDSYLGDIRIEHLLTHTVGTWPNGPTDPMVQSREIDQATLIATTLETRPLVKPPGGSFAYSNFGYCLLGRVIERLTKQPYAAFVQESVLARVGVSGLEIGGSALADRKPLEVRYQARSKDDPYAFNVPRMDSHGGWIARPAAIAQFASALGGVSSILRRDSIVVMTTPSQVNESYAKGWRISRSKNWWHTGHLPGTTGLLVRAHTGLTWCVLLNTRHRGDQLDKDLDRLMWAMVRTVPRWRA